MQLLFVVGRVIFVSVFVYGGVQRLIDVAGTAAVIARKFSVPHALIGPVTQVENAIGMSAPQLLATFGGALELVAGLLIAFNVGVRGMAPVLIALTAISTFYLNDFWNMGEAGMSNVVLALQNVSIFGALLVFMALGSSQPGARKPAGDV